MDSVNPKAQAQAPAPEPAMARPELAQPVMYAQTCQEIFNKNMKIKSEEKGDPQDPTAITYVAKSAEALKRVAGTKDFNPSHIPAKMYVNKFTALLKSSSNMVSRDTIVNISALFGAIHLSKQCQTHNFAELENVTARLLRDVSSSVSRGVGSSNGASRNSSLARSPAPEAAPGVGAEPEVEALAEILAEAQRAPSSAPAAGGAEQEPAAGDTCHIS